MTRLKFQLVSYSSCFRIPIWYNTNGNNKAKGLAYLPYFKKTLRRHIEKVPKNIRQRIILYYSE